jgi:Flp pilus assembly protein TadB
MFPFDITFKKKLSPEFDSISDEKIMSVFKQSLEQSKAEIVTDGKNKISFEKNFFKFTIFATTKEKIWFGIGKANFEITESYSLEGRTAVYSFNMLKFWILMIFFTVIFVLVNGIFQRFDTYFTLFLIVIYLANWVFLVMRHYFMFAGNFKNLLRAENNRANFKYN